MAETLNGEATTATDNLRELAEASKQLLDAGQKMKDNLSDLSDRVEHAKQVSFDAFKSPWLIAGGAALAGTLILAFSRKH